MGVFFQDKKIKCASLPNVPTHHLPQTTHRFLAFLPASYGGAPARTHPPPATQTEFIAMRPASEQRAKQWVPRLADFVASRQAYAEQYAHHYEAATYVDVRARYKLPIKLKLPRSSQPIKSNGHKSTEKPHNDQKQYVSVLF